MNDVLNNYNRATLLLEKGKYDRAISLYKKVLKMYPCKEAYTNIGNCYRGKGLDADMFSAYEKALDSSVPYLQPGSDTHLHALNNLGLAHYMYGRDDVAIKLYTKAIKLKPDFWEAWWNCSTAMLRKASSGDTTLFSKGWEMYKARFLKSGAIKLKNKRADLVYWDTISSGDAIIILAEQGIGDNIMFGRYLSKLPFKRIYVQCDASLDPIFSDYICVRDAIDVDEPTLVAYPMCSLGECFEDIPAGDWLKDKFDALEFDNSRPNVGIVWSGSPTHANNAYRSVNIERFNRLSSFANLYSLSPNFKSTRHVKSLDIKSWEDTARAINGLDLVIGVDTSVMHMCGSLGRPGLLLQPYKETDFRWGVVPSFDTVSTKSIWYSSIDVINNPQSWETVFDRVEEIVCAL